MVPSDETVGEFEVANGLVAPKTWLSLPTLVMAWLTASSSVDTFAPLGAANTIWPPYWL